MICVRVYSNGDKKFIELADQEDVLDWVAYNQYYRFGNALFVDGSCQYKSAGYFTDEQIAAMEANPVLEDGSAADEDQLFRGHRARNIQPPISKAEADA